MMPSTQEVLEALKGAGLRMTDQRRAIVGAIMSATGHINPPELVRTIEAQVPGVNPSTIYRTLSLLEELGILTHTHLHGGIEYHHAGRNTHVHLVCSGCGEALSLDASEVEEFRQRIERKTGFVADPTHFAVAGLCRDCSGRQA